MTAHSSDSSVRMGGAALLAAAPAVFDGLNRYLGNYLGEFVGELSLNVFFLLSARAMWRSRIVPRWIAGFGLASGALGLIALWRNVTDAVAPVAALNNAVLPLWMIVFGVTLLAIGYGRVRTAS